MATLIRRKVLADLVEQRLSELAGSNVTVYRGEVPEPPPAIMTSSGPDPSGRVAPYVVLFTGAGTPVIEQDLADSSTELGWSFQTTVVAGYDADCGDLVDRVHGLLYRWRPTLAGHAFGRVAPPPGFDPGPVRPQEIAGVPPRFFLPLQWRLPVTTS